MRSQVLEHQIPGLLGLAGRLYLVTFLFQHLKQREEG